MNVFPNIGLILGETLREGRRHREEGAAASCSSVSSASPEDVALDLAKSHKYFFWQVAEGLLRPSCFGQKLCGGHWHCEKHKRGNNLV